MAEFRTALNLDPQNEFALQRVRDALGLRRCTLRKLRAWSRAPTRSTPNHPGESRLHYRGDTRGLLTAVAASYGLT